MTGLLAVGQFCIDMPDTLWGEHRIVEYAMHDDDADIEHSSIRNSLENHCMTSPKQAIATTTPPYATGITIPKDKRADLNALTNGRLADAIDLQMQMKQAHWNVKGPNFIGLHKLFDEVYQAVTGYVDTIAERIVQLGGVAEGTVRLSSARTRLDEFPLGISDGSAHVVAVAKALAAFGGEVRTSISVANDLDDADTADVFTEVSRGIDKWLWFIEAHHQSRN